MALAATAATETWWRVKLVPRSRWQARLPIVLLSILWGELLKGFHIEDTVPIELRSCVSSQYPFNLWIVAWLCLEAKQLASHAVFHMHDKEATFFENGRSNDPPAACPSLTSGCERGGRAARLLIRNAPGSFRTSFRRRCSARLCCLKAWLAPLTKAPHCWLRNAGPQFYENRSRTCCPRNLDK